MADDLPTEYDAIVLGTGKFDCHSGLTILPSVTSYGLVMGLEFQIKIYHVLKHLAANVEGGQCSFRTVHGPCQRQKECHKTFSVGVLKETKKERKIETKKLGDI